MTLDQNNSANLSNDALGLGKAAEAICDLVSRGVGTIYADTFLPALEARKIKIISAAETEAQHEAVLKEAETLFELDKIAQRAGKRVLVREIRRQNNIEKIIALSSHQITDDEVPNEKVETDWATRFFNIAQDITEENVQQIWAKILAGELKKPGTFNIRTLEILKNITQNEALVFNKKVCPLIFDGSIIIKIDNENDLSKFGLPYSELMQMRDAGLIAEGDSTFSILLNLKDRIFSMRMKNSAFVLKGTADKFNLSIFILSTAGRDLYQIQDFEINKNYLDATEEYLVKNGFIDLTKPASTTPQHEPQTISPSESNL